MTAPFEWSYTLSTDEAFDIDQFNTAITELESYVNAMQAQVDSLAAAAAPDLSGYVTTSTFNAHLASMEAHLSYLLGFAGGTALYGTDHDGTSAIRAEIGTVTLSGGTGTFTYDTAFTNGILGTSATVVGGTAHAVAVNTPTNLTDVGITGTSTDVISVLVWGW